MSFKLQLKFISTGSQDPYGYTNVVRDGKSIGRLVCLYPFATEEKNLPYKYMNMELTQENEPGGSRRVSVFNMPVMTEGNAERSIFIDLSSDIFTAVERGEGYTSKTYDAEFSFRSSNGSDVDHREILNERDFHIIPSPAMSDHYKHLRKAVTRGGSLFYEIPLIDYLKFIGQ